MAVRVGKTRRRIFCGRPFEGTRMLVLTRREGERVVIGADVVVEIVEVRGDRIRLGITAPRSVAVHREEVKRAIDEADGRTCGCSGEHGTVEGGLLCANCRLPAR